MHRIVARLAPWLLLAAFGGPAIASAQDTYPPVTPPAGPVPVAPEPAPVATPAPSAEAQPVAAAPAAPAKSDVAGWFRIDSDWGGLQLWAGAAHPLGGNVALASDIYVYGSFGEFDLGPAITLGPAVITPMLGLQIDWSKQKAASLVPQFYTIVDGGPVYFESWLQLYLYDIFDKTQLSFLHTRDFLLFKASERVAIGVEADINFAVKNKATQTNDKLVYWLPIGPHLKLHYGEASTLELFVGYDVMAKDEAGAPVHADNKKLAGRFTFVQTW